jgi:glycosyltransferase involved in cell wall biosynthesis
VDKTYEKAKSIKSKNLTVLGYEKNHGKGYAVRYGVEHTNGDLIGFIDAGMDVDPAEIAVAIGLLVLNGADVVVGSKLHPDSKVNYPRERRVLSWGYRAMTHMMFGFSVRDAQVGLKLFRRKAAKDIFSRILVKKFAFDIEILAVAYALGYKIVESPIKIDFKQNSTISSKNFWRVIFSMLWDTSAVFYRLKIKHYYDK